MPNEQFNARLPQITHECIDLLVETYGMTKTQVIILAVDRLTRDLYPEGNNRAAKTEAWILARNKDESGNVEQAG
jgi:hypothetical protein